MNYKTLVKLILFVIISAIIICFIDINELIRAIKQINGWILSLTLTLLVLSIIIRSVRFYYICVHFLKLKFDNLYLFGVNMVSMILSRFSPGKLGDSAKVIFFKRDKKKLLIAYILERLSDLIVLSLLSFYALLKFFSSYILFLFIILGFIAIGLFLSRKYLPILFEKIFKISIYEISEFILKNKLKLFSFILYSFLIFMNNYFAYYILSFSYEVQTDFFDIVIYYSFSILVGIFSCLPGGFGSREFSFSYFIAKPGKFEASMIFSVSIITVTVLAETISACLGYILLLISRDKDVT